MSTAPVIKTVDGEEYIFNKLPVETSIPLLAEVTKIVGPALAAFYDSALKSGGEGKIDNLQDLLDADIDLSRVATLLFDQIDPDRIVPLFKKLLSATQYKGQVVSDVFGVVFLSKEVHMFKVAKTAFEVQYGDFFSARGMFLKDLEDEGSPRKEQP